MCAVIQALGILIAVLLVASPLHAHGRSGRSSAETIPRGSWNARLGNAQSYLGSFKAARRALRGKGGLVQLKRDLPTVVIPDLHGRRDYLDKVLATTDPASGRTYGQLLQRRQVQVLCLGDVMHSEVRGRLWRRTMPAQAMKMEMAESLGTLKRLADLKAANPDHFHMLRGNHDDVGPASGQVTCRLPRQIAHTRSFLQRTFGQRFTKELACLFSELPAAATGKGFVASHSNPMFSVTRHEVQDNAERAVVSLTRARMPSFNSLRRRQRGGGVSALRQVAQALGGSEPGFYIHGHLWARPMTVEGSRVYFGNQRDQTFLRLDPTRPLQPWNQLFRAGSGRQVTVRR
jgi:Calcineurin-like phosphoesterase